MSQSSSCQIRSDEAAELIGVPFRDFNAWREARVRRRENASICDFVRDYAGLSSTGLDPTRVISAGHYGVAVGLTDASGRTVAVAKFSTVNTPDAEPVDTLLDRVGPRPPRHTVARDQIVGEYRKLHRVNRLVNDARLVPNAIDFYTVERDARQDNTVLLMNYVDAIPLFQKFYEVANGRESMHSVAQWGECFGSAIATFYELGIAHGDLHAGNILVRRDDNMLSFIDWERMAQRSDSATMSEDEWIDFAILRDVFTLLKGLPRMNSERGSMIFVYAMLEAMSKSRQARVIVTRLTRDLDLSYGNVHIDALKTLLERSQNAPFFSAMDRTRDSLSLSDDSAVRRMKVSPTPRSVDAEEANVVNPPRVSSHRRPPPPPPDSQYHMRRTLGDNHRGGPKIAFL